jgi:hypothetical protein
MRRAVLFYRCVTPYLLGSVSGTTRYDRKLKTEDSIFLVSKPALLNFLNHGDLFDFAAFDMRLQSSIHILH